MSQTLYPYTPVAYAAAPSPPQAGMPGWLKLAGLGLSIFLLVRGCENTPQPGPNPNPTPGKLDAEIVRASEEALKGLGGSYSQFFEDAAGLIKSGDIKDAAGLDAWFVENSIPALERGTSKAMTALTDKLPSGKFEGGDKDAAINAVHSMSVGFDKAAGKL
jgi:hypothetical protein